MEEPGGLRSIESHRVGRDWSGLAAAAAASVAYWSFTCLWLFYSFFSCSYFLILECYPWTGKGSMLTMGSQRIRHNLATEQQQMLGKKILDMISAFLNVLRLALWLVSLLMSYLDALSIGESGALNFPAIFVLLWISPFHVCLMCRDAPVLGAHILTSFVSPSWIDLIITWCLSLSLAVWYILKSIVSDMSITTSAFFCFPFPWNTFFHPLTFSLYVPYIWNWSLVNRLYMGLVLVSIQLVYFFWSEHVIPLLLR